MPLHIETRHDERVVALTCETCDVVVEVRTLDPDFVPNVQAFFDEHTLCSRSLDLTRRAASG